MTFDDGRDQIDTFDVELSQNVDHIVIYRTTDDSLEAIPFYHRRVADDGTEWYDEPTHFTVTDDYRDAIAANSTVPIDNLTLNRPTDAYSNTPL